MAMQIANFPGYKFKMVCFFPFRYPNVYPERVVTSMVIHLIKDGNGNPTIDDVPIKTSMEYLYMASYLCDVLP